MLLSRRRQLPTNRTRHEQDKHDRRCNPEWPVEVGIALQHIEEVGARVQRCPAPLEHFICVDVEELRVEGDAPEEFLGRSAAGGSAASGAVECVRVGCDFVARIWLFEVYSGPLLSCILHD